MKYVKLINNQLHYPSNPFVYKEQQIFNPPIELYTEEGYKEFVETERPAPSKHQTVKAEFTEDDTHVYLTHKLVQSPPISPEVFEQQFKKQFIITDYGCIRANTAWGTFLSIKPNYDIKVQLLGHLPENSLILYPLPSDFSIFQYEDELENYLVKNSFKNKEISLEDYAVISQLVDIFYLGQV